MRMPLLSLAVVVVLLATCATPEQATTDDDPRAADAGGEQSPAAADPAPEPPAPADDEPAGVPAGVPLAPPPPPDPLALPAEGPPVAPDDVAALAALITAAEQAIRDPGRPPESLEAAGHWQQVTSRALVARPELVEPVLAEVPIELHGAVRGNVFAGQRLLAMHTPSDPSKPVQVRDLPRWRIVPPPPADELKSYYLEGEAASGVHWTYLAAVNLVETRMGRIRGDSVAGAQGPMQFMPATWAQWGEGDIQDHRDAIRAAARYLQWGGMPGDVNGALFRYNRDVRYVDAVRTYAEQMQGDPRAYYGYYHWQVYYNTRADDVWLAPGYDATGSG